MFANDLFKQITKSLENISTEPETEALLILENIFNITKRELLFNKEVQLTRENREELESVLARREKREPLQYIFQEQYFFNHKFYVDSRVLIPRPETELLVEKVIELEKRFTDKNLLIADIGCGSGAIAISLALSITRAIVYSTDISQDAFNVAKINSNNLNVPENKLFLIHGDKLEPFRQEKQKFHIIVSNPPYIPNEQYIDLEKEVIDYEPKDALLGLDEDGLGFYRYISQNIQDFILPGGFVCCEFGYGQADKLADILKQNKIFYDIQIIKDYNSIERIVIARVNL